jgi:rRNA maturation RNase YbeY
MLKNMSLRNIQFFSEDIDFTLKNKEIIRKWISNTIKAEGFKKNGELNFIFCNDEYLLSINQQYLDHNTYTDIITFDNSNDEGIISGDIFISIERIKENASTFKVEEAYELHRVMIHGILHLCGYLDDKKEDKELMTKKEDFYLSKLPISQA